MADDLEAYDFKAYNFLEITFRAAGAHIVEGKSPWRELNDKLFPDSPEFAADNKKDAVYLYMLYVLTDAAIGLSCVLRCPLTSSDSHETFFDMMGSPHDSQIMWYLQGNQMKHLNDIKDSESENLIEAGKVLRVMLTNMRPIAADVTEELYQLAQEMDLIIDSGHETPRYPYDASAMFRKPDWHSVPRNMFFFPLRNDL